MKILYALLAALLLISCGESDKSGGSGNMDAGSRDDFGEAGSKPAEIFLRADRVASNLNSAVFIMENKTLPEYGNSKNVRKIYVKKDSSSPLGVKFRIETIGDSSILAYAPGSFVIFHPRQNRAIVPGDKTTAEDMALAYKDLYKIVIKPKSDSSKLIKLMNNLEYLGEDIISGEACNMIRLVIPGKEPGVEEKGIYYMSKNDGLIRMLNILQIDGSDTLAEKIYWVRGLKRNPPLPDDFFTLTIPDSTIIEKFDFQ